MIKRVMVVVLLGCVGLTAGVTLGTLFSGTNISRAFTATSAAKPFPSALMPFQSNCHGDMSCPSTPVLLPKVTVRHLLPSLDDLTVYRRLIYSGVPMRGYVLLGLLAGLSAAVGFLVPSRSRLTRR